MSGMVWVSWVILVSKGNSLPLVKLQGQRGFYWVAKLTGKAGHMSLDLNHEPLARNDDGF